LCSIEDTGTFALVSDRYHCKASKLSLALTEGSRARQVSSYTSTVHDHNEVKRQGTKTHPSHGVYLLGSQAYK
jgi:hypothetical protein